MAMVRTVVTLNVAPFELVVKVRESEYRPGVEYVAVTFCIGSPVSLEASTVWLFPLPKYQTYSEIVQLEFAGVSKKPPVGLTTSPALKTGAVGFADDGKLIVGTDASCA